MAEKDIRKGWKPFELKAVIAQKTEQLASKDARIKELNAVREQLLFENKEIRKAEDRVEKENAALKAEFEKERAALIDLGNDHGKLCVENAALEKTIGLNKDTFLKELQALRKERDVFLRETWHAIHTKKSWKVRVATDGALRKVMALKSEVRK